MAKPKEKPGVLLYWETFEMFERAKPEKVKLLLRAIQNFSRYGQRPDFGDDEALNLVWPQLEQKLIADGERFEKIREQRRNAVNSRWEKEKKRTATGDNESIQPYSKDTDDNGSMRNIPTTVTTTATTTATSTTTSTTTTTDDIADKPPRNRFVPPSVEEVREYCQTRGNNVDAQRFVDYYTSNGWMVGRNKMKDWKAAVHTWERNEFNRSEDSNGKNQRGNKKSEWEDFELPGIIKL